MAFVALIWIIPIPLSICTFLGFVGRYDYNSELFFCEQGWSRQNVTSGWLTVFFLIASFVVPFLVIVFLNWSVYKTAEESQREIQMGDLAGSESQRQEMTMRTIERKAAVDVGIIIAAFLLCFLSTWIMGLCRQFAKSTEVPAEVVQVTACILFISSLCTPIIYSIRKRDFRTGVKNVLRRIGVRGTSDDIESNVIAMENLRQRGGGLLVNNLSTEASTSTTAAALATQHQDKRFPHGSAGIARLNLQRNNQLSPIPEMLEK